MFFVTVVKDGLSSLKMKEKMRLLEALIQQWIAKLHDIPVLSNYFSICSIYNWLTVTNVGKQCTRKYDIKTADTKQKELQNRRK